MMQSMEQNCERKYLRMIKLKKAWLIVLSTTIVLILAGCSIKTPLTQKKLTSEFQKNTVSLMNVHGYVTAKEQLKDKKAKNFNKYYNKSIQKEEKSVQKSLDALKGANNYKGYSSSVYQFSKGVLAYIKVAQKDQTDKANQKATQAKYHAVTKAAVKVGSASDSSKVKAYVTTIVGYDNQMKAKLAHDKKVKADKKKKANRPIIAFRGTGKHKGELVDYNGKPIPKKYLQKKKKAKHTISINPVLGTALLMVSGLLIITVFLQPNKSDDNSSALMDDSKRPKPRGYELLMFRLTELLGAILVILLIVLGTTK